MGNECQCKLTQSLVMALKHRAAFIQHSLALSRDHIHGVHSCLLGVVRVKSIFNHGFVFANMDFNIALNV